jgi:hypothetical protein
VSGDVSLGACFTCLLIILSGWNYDCPDLRLEAERTIRVCPAGHFLKLGYGNSESMSAIISYPAAITLTFYVFHTEAGADKLTLSSCPDISCSTKTVLLDGYSGSIMPSPVTSSTGVMLIEWKSDETATTLGWAATWNSGGESFQMPLPSLLTTSGEAQLRPPCSPAQCTPALHALLDHTRLGQVHAMSAWEVLATACSA